MKPVGTLYSLYKSCYIFVKPRRHKVCCENKIRLLASHTPKTQTNFGKHRHNHKVKFNETI